MKNIVKIVDIICKNGVKIKVEIKNIGTEDIEKMKLEKIILYLLKI